MKRIRCALVLGCFLLAAEPVSSYQQNPEDILRRSEQLIAAQGPQASLQFLQEQLQKAIRDGDTRTEGWVKAGLGRKAAQAGRYDLSIRFVNSARSLAIDHKDLLLEGIALGLSGYISRATGDARQAIRQYDAAFQRFAAVPPSDLIFDFVRDLTAAEIHLAEREHLSARAVELARKAGRVDFQAEGLKVWSSTLLNRGDFAGALEKLQEAANLTKATNNLEARADVLGLLGQLYRSHGNYRQAMENFDRALELYRQSGNALNESLMLQALGATSIKIGDRSKALEFIQRSADAAKRSGARVRVLANRLSVLGYAYIELGEYQRAIDTLEGVIRESADTSPPVAYNFLSAAYLHIGRLDEALDVASHGLTLVRERGMPEGVIALLLARGQALYRLGRLEDAMSDMRECLQVMEQARTRLVRTDSMKGSYTSRYRNLVNFAVRLFFEGGKAAEAFEIAEQARARSFLDLLGTRNSGGEEDILGQGLEALDPLAALSEEPQLPSAVSIPPANLKHVVQLAQRMRSSVIAYWVNTDELYVWVVGVDGTVSSARKLVTEKRLSALIQLAESRSTNNEQVFKELYRVLIAPIRAKLPESGSRLVVIPHGELFKLPFAALKDPRGRYLVEDYAINYIPAMATFDLVRERTQTQTLESKRYLLAADPINPARLSQGSGLVPLSGSRIELQNITAQIPRSSADVLTGSRLRREAVLQSLENHDVIHFATHAVIDSRQPFESFLALSEGERLTVRDVYDIPMNADLVMLSACRSASGTISAEGVLGLSRAFFYAGTASVIASIWDVPDEPSAMLVNEFYREYRRTGQKDRALRAGQLRLIEALRAGRVRATTPAGLMVLPEHPSLWAGFVLIGEPGN